MKQILVIFMVFVSFAALAKEDIINLGAMDSLQVNCPVGNVLTLQSNILKCGCPAGMLAHIVGENLKCDILCEIKIKKIQYWDIEYADQSNIELSRNLIQYNALVLEDKRGIEFYSERLYSPRSNEWDYLFNAAVKIAQTKCQKVLYKDQYIN
jgi:hypothetical protein